MFGISTDIGYDYRIMTCSQVTTLIFINHPTFLLAT